MDNNIKKYIKEINKYKNEMLSNYKDLIVLYEDTRQTYIKLVAEYEKLEDVVPVDIEFSYNIDNGEVIITGYNGSDVDIVIPLTIEELPVTTIDSFAFELNTTLKSINTSNVKTIREQAFASCSSLENAFMPKVTTLNSQAISSCTSLKSIVLSKDLYIIGSDVFLGSTLKNLTIDYGTEDISNISIYNWNRFVMTLTGLNTSTISGKYVKNNMYIYDLEKELYYKENGNELTLIDYYGSNTNIIIPKTINTKPVIAIGSYVFKGDTSIVSIDIADVVTIGHSAFNNCSKLINIIGNKVTDIGISVFQGCVKLEKLNFPEVLTVDQRSFESMSSLNTVSFPKLTTIKGEFTFSGCINLTSIDLPSLTSISEYAFAYCRSLKNVNIPQVTSMSEGVFSQCVSLNSIELKNIEEIGMNAFYDCIVLSELIIWKKARTIGSNVFTNCSINSLTIYYGNEDISAITIDDWNRFVSSIGLIPSTISGKYIMNDYETRELK